MIQFGQYDAFDKWEILCAYWMDRKAVPELGVDKFKRPRLPRWEAAALAAGNSACIEYLRAKVKSFDGFRPPSEDDRIGGEIYRLIKELGYAELQKAVGGVGAAIAEGGLVSPVSGPFSASLAARFKSIFMTGAIGRLQWTEEPGEIPTVEIIRAQRPLDFPINAIKQKRNALCMFCAQFYGRSDISYIHDVCPDRMTLVDNNAALLEEMKLIYPTDWNFHCADYKDFLAKTTENGNTYDLVICDTWAWIAREVAWDQLPNLMNICSGTLILNYFGTMLSEIGVPPEDLVSLSEMVSKKTGTDVLFKEMLRRGSGVYWAVIEKG